jgi:NAD(P)-dependent dehydrogenase (short-subunit alcohol dehydrogenase family)
VTTQVVLITGSGIIINISSTYGHKGTPAAPLYAGSKHAIEGLMKSVALETAKSGIRVNAVAPGPTAARPQTDYRSSIQKV